ncbi:glycosyltransferase family 2 protein [Priestia megaterium]|uniref:glycosyltransferase family 2 protein n=1 Tax=Priestia megaterium TaxID=1404 RepID=UPI001C8E05C6|nr:glycosyltransferase family 2 protein [Priestia megaterium]MBY0196841.1 glycosyltransferase family 2 protein [Priestia megaterium]
MKEVNEMISVIIPTFNRRDIISRSIASVLNQTYKNIEVLVIDDASTDDTDKVVKKIKDPRVKYFRLRENTQGTVPRNYGIEKSSGEYIAFLDSDDEWFPKKLELQINYIKSYGEKANNVLCFTNADVKINDKKINKVINDECLFKSDIVNYIFENNNFVQTSTFMIKADIAKRIKFNSSLKKHQDYDFCIRLQKQGVEFLLLDETLTLYYSDVNSNQISSFNLNKIKTSMNWFEENQKYFNENSRKVFRIQNYLYFYILSGKKKIAIQLIKEAYKANLISLQKVLKVYISLIVPKVVLQKKLR